MHDDKTIDIDFSAFEGHIKEDIQEKKPRKRPSLNSKPPKKVIVWGSIAVLLLIIGAVFFAGHDENRPKNMVIPIQPGFAEIQATLQQLTAEVEENRKSVVQKLDKLTDKVERLQQRIAKLSPGNRAAGSVMKHPASAAQKRYHTVRRGENLSVIARKYGLSVRELCELNGITPQRPIYSGQKLVVKN